MTDFTGKFMEGFTEEVTFELDSDSWVQQRSMEGGGDIISGGGSNVNKGNNS